MGSFEADRANSWLDVQKRLQQQIITGQLRPRQRLVEDEVMEQAGATRHAVRRAFDELGRMGLVTKLANKGVSVRDYTPTEVEELYEIRNCLETCAALRFRKPAPDELVASLTALAESHRSASRNRRYTEVFSLNNSFHELLYGASGNEQLAAAIKYYTFSTHPIRTRAFMNDELREIAIADHFEMIDAISKGDGERLAGIVVEHIRRPKVYYLENTSIPAA